MKREEIRNQWMRLNEISCELSKNTETELNEARERNYIQRTIFSCMAYYKRVWTESWGEVLFLFWYDLYWQFSFHFFHQHNTHIFNSAVGVSGYVTRWQEKKRRKKKFNFHKESFSLSLISSGKKTSGLLQLSHFFPLLFCKPAKTRH